MCIITHTHIYVTVAFFIVTFYSLRKKLFFFGGGILPNLPSSLLKWWVTYFLKICIKRDSTIILAGRRVSFGCLEKSYPWILQQKMGGEGERCFLGFSRAHPVSLEGQSWEKSTHRVVPKFRLWMLPCPTNAWQLIPIYVWSWNEPWRPAEDWLKT